MSKILELRNKRNKLWEQTKAFLEEHRDENGLVAKEAVEQYDKMAKDVIGLHYTFEQQMHVHKETLPDGNTGFAVEVNVQETISRSDTSQPTSHLYHVTALLNQEQKFVRMNITL